MKRAYVVGVDAYDRDPLRGCVNDACNVAELLRANANGSPNFDVSLETSIFRKSELRDGVRKLFAEGDDIETALFYFSGHGMFMDGNGYLVLPDVYETRDGLAMREVLDLANDSAVKNKIIILDCCMAGSISVAGNYSMDPYVHRGVTILAACKEKGKAVESADTGLFSSLLCEALRGGAAGVCGMVTPGNVYAFIDRSLGPWCQRPVFVSHVTSFVSIRECAPKVPLEILRHLPELFPSDGYEYKLDPSFEDTNTVDSRSKPVEPYAKRENVAVFKELQKLQSVGIVEPVDAPFMYFAAMESKSCRLTALGVHYMHLARDHRI